MRLLGFIIVLIAMLFLAHATWTCVIQSLDYKTEAISTLGNSTGGASVPLQEHAGLANRAAQDIESVGFQIVGGSLLSLGGSVVLLIAGKKRK